MDSVILGTFMGSKSGVDSCSFLKHFFFFVIENEMH